MSNLFYVLIIAAAVIFGSLAFIAWLRNRKLPEIRD